jgi:hypothetical protein
MAFLDKIDFSLLLIASLTLGLAPFVPEPHIWEKLKMLAAGELVKPIDMFDLVFHGIPWALLIAKGIRELRKGGAA